MSAVNASITSTSLDAERRAHEPSMEEILASIRRIIADDEALPVVRRDKERIGIEPHPAVDAPRGSEPAPPPLETADPTDADDSRSRAPVVVPVRLPQAVASKHSVPHAAPALEPQDFWLRPTLRPEPERERADDVEAEEARWAHDSAAEAPPEIEEANELRDDVVAEERDDEDFAGAEEASEAPSQPLVSPDAAASVASHFQALAASMVINEAGVIERYAQDILRPMLKQWLDDNLPTLVERLVRAEIERVARGRR